MKRIVLSNERIFRGKYGWNASFSSKVFGSEDEYINAYVNIKEVKGLDIDEMVKEAGITDVTKGVVVDMSGFMGAQHRVINDEKVVYPQLIINEIKIIE